jgi:hypothetical protein
MVDSVRAWLSAGIKVGSTSGIGRFTLLVSGPRRGVHPGSGPLFIGSHQARREHSERSSCAAHVQSLSSESLGYPNSQKKCMAAPVGMNLTALPSPTKGPTERTPTPFSGARVHTTSKWWS